MRCRESRVIWQQGATEVGVLKGLCWLDRAVGYRSRKPWKLVSWKAYALEKEPREIAAGNYRSRCPERPVLARESCGI